MLDNTSQLQATETEEERSNGFVLVDLRRMPMYAVNVANFVSTKLRGSRSWSNYKSWKQQMLCLVESQGLIGYINGKAPPPSPKDDEDYGAWRRTDWLVKGWILGALSDETLQNVVHLDSARDVWLDLENDFSTDQVQQGNNNLLLSMYSFGLKSIATLL